MGAQDSIIITLDLMDDIFELPFLIECHSQGPQFGFFRNTFCEEEVLH